MSSSSLKAGVVGLGWAGQQHLKAYQALPGVELVAVAESNDSLREQIRQEFGVPKGYSDFHQLLNTENPDLVSVATPNFAHAEISIAAMENGAHVLVEKPLASTYLDGRDMVEAAKRHDRVMQVTFNQRYRPDVQLLKKFVEEGGTGDLYHVKSRWLRRDGIPGNGSKWFVFRELSGGGPLIDLGVHMLDMALYIMGEPTVEAVSGSVYDRLGQRFVTRACGESARYEVEDFATALIRLGGGRTLQLEASWATYRENGDLINMTLFGERGGAELTVKNYRAENAVRFFVDSAGVPGEIIPAIPSSANTVPGHQQVAEQFVERVRGGNYERFCGEEGLLRTWIIDAVYRSAAAGREIRLSELEQEYQALHNLG